MKNDFFVCLENVFLEFGDFFFVNKRYLEDVSR